MSMKFEAWIFFHKLKWDQRDFSLKGLGPHDIRSMEIFSKSRAPYHCNLEVGRMLCLFEKLERLPIQSYETNKITL